MQKLIAIKEAALVVAEAKKRADCASPPTSRRPTPRPSPPLLPPLRLTRACVFNPASPLPRPPPSLALCAGAIKRIKLIALIGDISSADGEISATGVQFSLDSKKGMGLYSTASAGLTFNGAAARYASQPTLLRTKLIRTKVRTLVDFRVGSTHRIKVNYVVAGAAKVSAVCTLTVTTAPPHDLALPSGWKMQAGGELRM